MEIPHVTPTTITRSRVFIDGSIDPEHTSIVLDSSNTDAGSTPPHRFRAGNVVAYKTSAGRYVEANDATADAASRATVASLEAADTDWDGETITTEFDGVAVDTEVLAGSDDTTAEVVTALNASYLANRLPLLATGSNGQPVVVTCALPGKHSLKLTSTLATAYGASGVEDTGGDLDVLVTTEMVDLKDEDGTAIHADARACRTGHFDESNLINLTAAAKAALERRGARFG